MNLQLKDIAMGVVMVLLFVLIQLLIFSKLKFSFRGRYDECPPTNVYITYACPDPSVHENVIPNTKELEAQKKELEKAENLLFSLESLPTDYISAPTKQIQEVKSKIEKLKSSINTKEKFFVPSIQQKTANSKKLNAGNANYDFFGTNKTCDYQYCCENHEGYLLKKYM